MSLHECTPENVKANEEYWKKLFENPDIWNSIPLLNVHNAQNFKENDLVRFQGMIQDMHNPEYYFEQYAAYDDERNVKVAVRNGKYRAIILGDAEMIQQNDPDHVTSERQTLVVISIPAVNEWVEKCENQLGMDRGYLGSAEQKTGLKRSLDDDNVEEMETDANKKVKAEGESSSNNTSTQSSLLSREQIFNFPIPDSTGKKCHIAVYEEHEDIKLNNICEFVGFFGSYSCIQHTDEEINRMELEAHYPPDSLVPKIHCFTFKKIAHNNPLVKEMSMPCDKMQFLKKELLIVLSQLLLGDDLAAEYLICHLISQVYMRKNFLCLGKFSMNISNIPNFSHIDYTKTLYDFIEMLMPKSHYLPMTLENMNDLSFVPKKDYQCERITSGLLQLSENTHLILDETKLSNGQLNSGGINNIKALSVCIKNQKVDYDFVYYSMEYECDIPVLVLSEGKSLLPTDCHIILQPDEACKSTVKEIIEAAQQFLKPELLNDIRKYLTHARLTKFELSEEIQNLVQQEFVNMRQRENKVTTEDLHNLLVLARLLSLTEGKNTLDESCWRKACEMEERRKARLPK